MYNKKVVILSLKIVVVSILVMCSVFLFVYVSNYYPAKEDARLLLGKPNVYGNSNMIVISSKEVADAVLVFYPGAKVEHIAYLPLLERLSERKITSILVKMPFNLAVFDINAAETVFSQMDEIPQKRYIAGHSLGGAMASMYAASHDTTIDGVILLGSYNAGNADPDKTLTIYGSEDTILNINKATADKNVIIIQGGNHAYFGDYGEQKGDGKALITVSEQQESTADIIAEFIFNTGPKSRKKG